MPPPKKTIADLERELSMRKVALQMVREGWTQKQCASHLTSQGFVVTQSTVSRWVAAESLSTPTST